MKNLFLQMSSKRRFREFEETSEISSKSTFELSMDLRGSRRGSWKSSFSPWARKSDFEDSMRPLIGAQNRPSSSWWILRISWDLWEERFWGFDETSDRSSKSTFELLMDFRGSQRGSWKTCFYKWARRGDFENSRRPLRLAQNRPSSSRWI